MRSPFTLAALLLALASVSFAQNATPVSLADVARQSKAQKSTAKHVWDDQNSDFGRTGEDAMTPCGAPIASLESGYVSSLMGKAPTDEQVPKALLRWLEKHSDLDVMHPEDIAKVNFPRTPGQVQANQAMAKAAADELERQASPNSSGDAVDISAVMNTPIVTNAGSTLAAAVRNEQQRRVRSDGSPADKLEEAVNLYSICESRRVVQFQDEVDRLAKQDLQKRLSPAAAPETAQGK